MDLSKVSTHELEFGFAKRQVDLIVLGMNVQLNGATDPVTKNALNSRISDLVATAEELTKRGIKLSLDLTKQHPEVQKMVRLAIEKSDLLKRRLPAPQKRLPPRKIPRRRLK